ncbi:HK97 gp10 family phage protein [Pontibacter mucosus]|uniref:HK97 gp10 family phage protein n=1 Tax=Pontibacter mucosus TaxID=1649266 RepID=A0A2T5YD61_9BACT|nr:HK97-gp10 family putative phage morphogenesis protein [Pontibacter mucosus]PTX14456.1 HK97 gp10 family phage protein [Pontibacter mucosus]
MAKVTGVSSVVRGLATFGQKGKEAAARVVQATAMDVRNEAISNAPVYMGKLRQSIINKVDASGLRVSTEVGVFYGAFVEFGTGMYVEVPAEMQAEAMKFKGMKGQGTWADLIEDLIDWVRQKGITGTYSVKTRRRTGNKRANDRQDAEVAYLIAMSIIRKGRKPQPYLYPAYVKYRAELRPRLRIALERLVKETNGRR